MKLSWAEVLFARGQSIDPAALSEIKAAGKAGDGARAMRVLSGAFERQFALMAAAGEAYPYEYRFRTAQARAIATAADRFPDLNGPAAQALGFAVAVDPNQAELVAMLTLTQSRSGQCAAARLSAQRLQQLAPPSKKMNDVLSSAMRCEASSPAPPD